MGGNSSYRVISNRQLIYCKWAADKWLRTHAFGSAPIINQKCRMIQTPGVNRIRLTFNYRSRNKSAIVWFNCPKQIASGAARLWLCILTRLCAIIKSQRGGRRNQFSVNTGCSFAGYNCYWVVNGFAFDVALDITSCHCFVPLLRAIAFWQAPVILLKSE